MHQVQFLPLERKKRRRMVTKVQNLAKNNAMDIEPEVGSKHSIKTQIESGEITRTKVDSKEGFSVEFSRKDLEIRNAWYSANVLSLEDDKACVLFSDLSVEEGTDKLKEWVALKSEGHEAAKIRSARSVTTLLYEGTMKRRI